MMAPLMYIGSFCWYEILAEHETVSATRYIEFSKRLMGRLRGNRKHAVLLLRDDARRHCHTSATSRIEQRSIQCWP